MQLIKPLFIIIFLISFSVMSSQKKEDHILICYGDFYPEKVKGYDYVIIEPSIFSKIDIATLKSQNKKILAYISLGEVSETASHYNQIKQETLGKNDIWNSHILDINATETKTELFNLIENHLEYKNFDGLFLDNIDNYTKFGPTPEKKEGLLTFLDSVKTKFPEKILMQNSGVLILDKTKEFIDVVAIESVATNFDFDKNKYRLREKKEFKNRIEQLTNASQKYQIPIILIEYSDNKTLTKEIKNQLKQYPFNYFIGKIDLQKIPEK